MTMKYFLILSLLGSLLTLSACQDKAAPSEAPLPKPAGKTGNNPGKPMAPVHITYRLSKDIQAGAPVVISLSLTPLVAAQQLSLRYTTEGALTTGDASPQFSFGATPAGTPLQQAIHVIPAADGRYRVIVAVTITSQTGQTSSRSLSIPIVVGQPRQTTLKPQGTVNTDAQGRPIIVLPAQEEVIHH
jgi:hypothetical protein